MVRPSLLSEPSSVHYLLLSTQCSRTTAPLNRHVLLSSFWQSTIHLGGRWQHHTYISRAEVLKSRNAEVVQSYPAKHHPVNVIGDESFPYDEELRQYDCAKMVVLKVLFHENQIWRNLMGTSRFVHRRRSRTVARQFLGQPLTNP